ncbi:MAG: fumarate hydratase, partial [Clostridia bacterium]|nr:fumarate hydratase [Clostridia bacterium]
MREINVNLITEKVAECFIDANLYLSSDLEKRINECAKLETRETAKETFSDMLSNLEAAKELQIPICQDCGMAVVFADIGQDVHLTGGSFEDAVNRGVAK